MRIVYISSCSFLWVNILCILKRAPMEEEVAPDSQKEEWSNGLTTSALFSLAKGHTFFPTIFWTFLNKNINYWEDGQDKFWTKRIYVHRRKYIFLGMSIINSIRILFTTSLRQNEVFWWYLSNEEGYFAFSIGVDFEHEHHHYHHNPRYEEHSYHHCNMLSLNTASNISIPSK